MLERKLDPVAPIALTANGGVNGQVQVADTAGFRVGQSAYLKDNATPANTLAVQIKRVIGSTQLIVGPIDNKLGMPFSTCDVSAWTTTRGSQIGAEPQNKREIPPDPHYLSVYEADPLCADRVIWVDKYGQYYDENNPLPISFDGTIQIGDVSIKDPNSGNVVKVNADGSINVVVESIPSPNNVVVSTYNEVTAVGAGIQTQVVSYTVPVGKQAVLQRCPVSGDNVARYDLQINAVTQDTLRTMFGGDLTGMFDFSSGNDSGLLLNAGDVIKILVLHQRPDPGTFEGRIQVLEITL